MSEDEYDVTPSIGEVLNMMEGYSYDLWDAVFELVDNSFDSFSTHGRKLSKAGKKDWEINIALDNNKREFRIWDNAYGMDKSELQRALVIAKANTTEGVIGKYGMGMKTSSSWLGKVWSVRTKRLGSNEELTATVDIPKLLKSSSNMIPIKSKLVDDPNSSYTIIEIKNAPRSYGPTTQAKTKKQLEMTYQKLLTNEKLTIYWKGEKLSYSEPDFLEESQSIKGGKAKNVKYNYKIKPFKINGSTVSGRYGIYEPKKTQVHHAGLTMFYNNRVILSRSTNKWMERIFGSGPGDLARQRLFLRLDVQLTPNALKTDFVWKEYTIEKLEKEIIEQTDRHILELRKIATKKRVGKGVLTTAQKKLSDADVKKRLESKDLLGALVEAELEAESGSDELTEAEADALKEAARENPPLKISIGGKGKPTVESYMGLHHSTEPFLSIKTEPKKIMVFLNPNHPFYTQKIGSDPELYQLYMDFCHCLALSKWTGDKQDSNISPATFLSVLDKYLRTLGKTTED